MPDPEISMTGGAARYDGLVGATLLVATPDDAEAPGTWTLVERDVLSVLMEEDDAGLLSPVFTAPEALVRWRPEGGCYVERDATWLFAVTTADPEGRVVVDPGSPTSFVLDPAEVAVLAEGRSPADAVEAASVLVATPSAPLTDAITAAVQAAMAAEPAVRSARVFAIDDTGTGPQPMVLVELEPDQDAVAIDETMGRVLEGIAARTPDAGGLRFGLVTDEWRATYEGGGLPLFAR